MTDTHEKTEKDNTLAFLQRVKEKGYIRPSEISQYYQKINHIMTDFLKKTPIVHKKAIKYMHQLSEISRRTPAFFSLFPDTMMDLYDRAITGELLPQREAETKLLAFFAYVSPQTIEQKNRLLDRIQRMPDFEQRENEIARVVKQLVLHYDQNQQFNEDPGLSVLKPLSSILHRFSRKKSVFGGRNNQKIKMSKSSFLDCAILIKEHLPEFYEDSWKEKFSPLSQRKLSIPTIGDPLVVYSHIKARLSPNNLFLGWEKE